MASYNKLYSNNYYYSTTFQQFGDGYLKTCTTTMPHTSIPYKQRANLIIWDWDDTMFPTHAFRTKQHKKDKDFMSKLLILASYLEQIFTKMIKLYGSSNIIIVTNSAPKWIDKCLNIDIIQDIFMNFQNILKQNKIKIISASKPEIIKKYPSNYYKWKEITFMQYFKRYFCNQSMNMSETINCITSIGDSTCEYKASDYASKYIPNRILNRIKFKCDPSINDIMFQLQYTLSITHQFGYTMQNIELDYSSVLKQRLLSNAMSANTFSDSDTTTTT